MADAVAGLGQHQAVTLGDGLQVDMVVRGLVVDLQQIVVNVADGQLGADPVQVQGLKGQVGHDRIDIVGQGLIHRQFDFITRHQFRRFGQMGLQ